LETYEIFKQKATPKGAALSRDLETHEVAANISKEFIIKTKKNH